jgi:putative DNA primase/helicase
MNKRVKAWSLHHEKNLPVCLRFPAGEPFDLLDGADVADLGKAIISAGGAGGLIILDTLARAAPGGDENSSSYMGSVIAAAKALQNLVGGLVLLVHHTGKDETKGMRGHSSLYAAADSVIEVSKTVKGRTWSVAKSKDDETGAVYPFKLEVVTTGVDDEGQKITSCVVAPDDDKKKPVPRAKQPAGGNQRIANDTLDEALRNSKEFGKADAPDESPCIRFDDAVRLVAARLTCDADRRNERAKAALNGLADHEFISLKDGWLWRTTSTHAP